MKLMRPRAIVPRYPYFDVVKTDWDAALTDGLARAAVAIDTMEYPNRAA